MLVKDCICSRAPPMMAPEVVSHRTKSTVLRPFWDLQHFLEIWTSWSPYRHYNEPQRSDKHFYKHYLPIFCAFFCVWACARVLWTYSPTISVAPSACKLFCFYYL